MHQMFDWSTGHNRNMFHTFPNRRFHQSRNSFIPMTTFHDERSQREILYELEQVNQRIQTLQMEISILKRQIKIIRKSYISKSISSHNVAYETYQKYNITEKHME